jgi:hypothetical protein
LLVVGKSANKSGAIGCGTDRAKGRARENVDQQTTRRAQNRESASQTLEAYDQAPALADVVTFPPSSVTTSIGSVEQTLYRDCEGDSPA